jgi:hypothetical protein
MVIYIHTQGHYPAVALLECVGDEPTIGRMYGATLWQLQDEVPRIICIETFPWPLPQPAGFDAGRLAVALVLDDWNNRLAGEPFLLRVEHAALCDCRPADFPTTHRHRFDTSSRLPWSILQTALIYESSCKAWEAAQTGKCEAANLLLRRQRGRRGDQAVTSLLRLAPLGLRCSEASNDPPSREHHHDQPPRNYKLTSGRGIIRPETRPCYNCGMRGHLAAVCSLPHRRCPPCQDGTTRCSYCRADQPHLKYCPFQPCLHCDSTAHSTRRCGSPSLSERQSKGQPAGLLPLR